MKAAATPIADKDVKRLRQQQKEWLDDIMERQGDNLTQMAEACNELAKRTDQKPISKETLRHFYNNYQTASSKEHRLLSDRVTFMLCKVYGLEPAFAPHLLYDMDKDTAETEQTPVYPYLQNHCLE